MRKSTGRSSYYTYSDIKKQKLGFLIDGYAQEWITVESYVTKFQIFF